MKQKRVKNKVNMRGAGASSSCKMKQKRVKNNVNMRGTSAGIQDGGGNLREEAPKEKEPNPEPRKALSCQTARTHQSRNTKVNHTQCQRSVHTVLAKCAGGLSSVDPHAAEKHLATLQWAKHLATCQWAKHLATLQWAKHLATFRYIVVNRSIITWLHSSC